MNDGELEICRFYSTVCHNLPIYKFLYRKTYLSNNNQGVTDSLKKSESISFLLSFCDKISCVRDVFNLLHWITCICFLLFIAFTDPAVKVCLLPKEEKLLTMQQRGRDMNIKTE